MTNRVGAVLVYTISVACWSISFFDDSERAWRAAMFLIGVAIYFRISSIAETRK